MTFLLCVFCFCFLNISVVICKAELERRRDRGLFHVSRECSSQDGARPKYRAKSFMWVPHVEYLGHLLFCQSHLYGNGSEEEL